MTIPWIDRLGEWNPQLFREIKGRLKPRNILIAVAVSLVSQLLLLMSFANQIPVPDENLKGVSSRYCTGTSATYGSPQCLLDGNSFIINWELWWDDVFIWLSIMGVFALLVVGTYMLIADLAKEEQRGTLNFLRLTPQSSSLILTGKLLGVPILLYLVGVLALPLHWVSGFSGQIPFSLILGYYGVLGAACLFFYSAALLFGLAGKWLGGFQAWLGSGMVLMFLYLITLALGRGSYLNHYPIDWLVLFNPEVVLPYLIGSNSLDAGNPTYYSSNLRDLTYFHVPVGVSMWSFAGLMVFNYGIWTYWAWRGLTRCFHNPSATLLGKQQSYWLTACFQAVILGFALNPHWVESRDRAKGLFENSQQLLVFNLLLFLCLIAALSPQRQAMQDWARYRHKQPSARKRSVMQDLIWGEKSPAVVAVALNVAIASSILIPWILLWPDSEYKIPGLMAVLVSMSLTLVYAAIAQLMLLMKVQKRASFAAATVGGLIVLPPIIFGLLSVYPSENAAAWLFSAFPWASVEFATASSVLVAIVGQSLAFTLLSLQLTRQLRKAGESATKAPLSGGSSVPML
jgi:hypothetical protein